MKGTTNHGFWSRLGPREAQVAALLVKGMQNGEIAALLGTTHNTVKKQVQRVLAKCGASNRTELAGLLAAEEFADGPSGPLRTGSRTINLLKRLTMGQPSNKGEGEHAQQNGDSESRVTGDGAVWLGPCGVRNQVENHKHR